jgi:hypothetical protein
MKPTEAADNAAALGATAFLAGWNSAISHLREVASREPDADIRLAIIDLANNMQGSGAKFRQLYDDPPAHLPLADNAD